MTATSVVTRRVARHDIDEAVAYSLVEKTFARLGGHRASGSARYAVAPNLPRL